MTQEKDGNAVRHAAAGAVRVEANRSRKAGKLRLRVTVKEGWHFNSNQPLEDYYIPTAFAVDGQALDVSQYPKATVKVLGFCDKPLSLFAGGFPLQIAQPDVAESAEIPAATLSFQACSNEICLQTEEMQFTLW